MKNSESRNPQPSEVVVEHRSECLQIEELPPDAQWAGWWDELEDGLTTSRRSVMRIRIDTSHPAHPPSVHDDG